jgi:predicted nuclease of predicted toxin-antitoxin system
MVEPVFALLQGRGHPVTRARDAGLAEAVDSDIVEYSLAKALVVVTFDRDLRDTAVRGSCQVLHIAKKEVSARKRLEAYYTDVVGLIGAGHGLVTLPTTGPPHPGKVREARMHR